MQFEIFTYSIFLIIISCSPNISYYPHKKSPFSGGEYKIGEPYQIEGRTFYPEESFDYTERGVASWYGPNFQKKDCKWRGF